MGFYLGIDGGASKTSCIVGDETTVLGSGVAGPSNLIRVSEERAADAFAAAIRQACTTANVNPQQITATCVGVAGAGRPEISETVRRLVSGAVSGHTEVVGDMRIALQAAFGEGPGVVVIAGTGSIAYGRNELGETARAGGWGFAASDEGSGYWIGRRAVSAIMRAHDEQESTSLAAPVMQALSASSWDELVLAVNASPQPDFSTVFPAVVSAAESGDSLAREVLSDAGRELANLASVAIRRLFRDSGGVLVAMSGGVFRNSALVRQSFYNQLRSEYPNAALNATVIDPVRGALELARKAAPR